MEQIRKFLFNAFFGGAVIILPIFILYKLVVWLIGLFSGSVAPITAVLTRTFDMQTVHALLLTAISLFIICALIGMLVRTRFGSGLHQSFENAVLGRIPGYKTIRDIITQVTGGQQNLFKRVVLLHFSKNGPSMTGFVVDEYAGNGVTVFVPTAPNPTSGIVIHTSSDKITELDITIETAFKSIIACGSGSGRFIPQMYPAVDAKSSNTL